MSKVPKNITEIIHKDPSSTTVISLMNQRMLQQLDNDDFFNKQLSLAKININMFTNQFICNNYRYSLTDFYRNIGIYWLYQNWKKQYCIAHCQR